MVSKDRPTAIDVPLSVADRARLTTGADLWSTHPEPRLGLPALRTSDGPNGVRGSRFDERLQAWCTPCGTGLAATFDPQLLRRVGELIGDEARRMDVDVVLGPTMNLHRSPLGGRGFECYSEDPVLSGLMAAAWITGVQSRGVAATAKHFVANDSERHRTRVNCIVDDRALRELYLVPFEYAVRAGVWALMASYNQINGTYAAQHRPLLDDLLKGEWRFDGVVLSDWGAARDTVGCAMAGLDLEMPVGRTFGSGLAAAVDAGLIPESVLDDKVERLLRLAQRIRGHRSRHPPAPDSGQPPGGDPAELLTEVAAAGFVLLKNEQDLLPLSLREGGGPLAVIGPNAVDACHQGGGSAWVNTGELKRPLDALVERYAGVVEVLHEPGCTSRRSFLPLEMLGVRASSPLSEPGLSVTYHVQDGAEVRVTSERRGRSFLSWHDGIQAFAPDLLGSVQLSTWLTPTRSGTYEFSIKGSGTSTLRLDGVVVASLESQSDENDVYAAFFSPAVGRGSVTLLADVPVLLEAVMVHEPVGIPLLEVGCRAPEPEDLLSRAVQVARRAQLVILVVGTSTDVEAESVDRSTIDLPGDQDALIEAVLAVNPRTVVVVNAGVAVGLPWLARASTVLYTWLPGHGFAPALAQVLSGEREPGGRLPITLAARAEDYPAYDTTPDADERLAYVESVLIGYRHFTAHRLVPAFPFGHGLGYTDFAYGPLTLTVRAGSDGFGVEAALSVTNVGRRPGKEVVQLYVSPPESELVRPPVELKAVAVLQLALDETRPVFARLDARAFAHWDVAAQRWVIDAGIYTVHAGRSSQDLRQSVQVEIPAQLIG